MKASLAFLAVVVGLASAQFKNGRILEPPVPALCAQRVIHERTPDGKMFIALFAKHLAMLCKVELCLYKQQFG